MSDELHTAEDRWRHGLEGLAIPQHILDGSPISPWGFDPSTFAALADAAIERATDSPSDAAARSALPAGGTVLDVGAGAGAASLRLHEPAGELVAVDPSAALLAAFTERAERLGVAHRAVVGSWPDVADQVPVADVVTCHHVTYNVPELAAFARGLDTKAIRAVVIEMTVEHPLTWMAPLWESLHGLERPSGPTSDDASAVLRALGFDVVEQRWTRAYAALGEREPGQVETLARRLCIGEERHDELEALLEHHQAPPAREVVTLRWPSEGSR